MRPEKTWPITTARPPDVTFDFTDPDMLTQGPPLDEFARLRKTAPVWWNAQPYESGFEDDGYWVISRHVDVAAVFRDNKQWSSKRNGVIMALPEAVGTPEMRDLYSTVIINQDVPDHTRLRKLLSRLFTPRAIAHLEEALRQAARRIVADAVASGSGNFVDDVSAKLPAMAIAELIGVPAADRDEFAEWSSVLANTDDPEVMNGRDLLTLQAQVFGYTYAMAEQRRQVPAGDIVTRLIQPDDSGDVLGETEFAMFVLLLAVAGSETTRNAITHGLNAFCEHPDQWELFKQERPVTAVDEILRWATPVHCLQRTAVQDSSICGTPIRQGQRVGLFMSSANYDEDVFVEPRRFDILRNPNPHLTFGGHGIHYCLGANLARMEIRLIFDELASQAPHIRKLAEPRRLRSGWVNGVRELPVCYRG